MEIHLRTVGYRLPYVITQYYTQFQHYLHCSALLKLLSVKETGSCYQPHLMLDKL